MSISGIQGQLLEVTVVGCNKLKDTEWISRQDPYVCLEYGSTKFRTRTCTDGGKNPTFQEKFVFSLIEGLREIDVAVWNSNTITYDDFIGKGKVQLHKVLSHGYDDTAWPIQTKNGRHAGEVRLIMHYANARVSSAPSAPPYAGAAQAQVLMFSAPPASYRPPTTYPPQSTTYPPPSAYPQSAYPSPYPPNPAYPPSAYPSPYRPNPAVYPPEPYPPVPYPPHPYPPQQAPYPPPGSYPGIYPPPPY